MLTKRFGTVDYFMCIAQAKVSKPYQALLGVSAITMVTALIHLVVRVEQERMAGNLTETQYNSMYETLCVGYLLNIFAIADLLEGPPDVLAFFAHRFDVASTNRAEVLQVKRRPGIIACLNHANARVQPGWPTLWASASAVCNQTMLSFGLLHLHVLLWDHTTNAARLSPDLGCRRPCLACRQRPRRCRSSTSTPTGRGSRPPPVS